jgi:hypothetical protein
VGYGKENMRKPQDPKMELDLGFEPLVLAQGKIYLWLSTVRTKK